MMRSPTPEAEVDYPDHHVHMPTQSVKLPKLSLPSFHGDPLQRQSFWDAFDVAIHSNYNLSGVKIFTY